MRKNKAFFDALYNQYNRRGLLHPDPLEFLRQWPADVREREVGALLAACFAYGNVQAILKNLQKLFAIMPLPRTYILAATPQKLRRDFKHFKYRFTTAQELADFLLSIQKILRRCPLQRSSRTANIRKPPPDTALHPPHIFEAPH